MQSVSHQTLVIGSQKSVFVAFLLSVLFGPLGMLYATAAGGLVMLFLSIVAAFFTFGLGLLFTWPVCVLWAVLAASRHNRRFHTAAQGAAVGRSGTPTF